MTDGLIISKLTSNQSYLYLLLNKIKKIKNNLTQFTNFIDTEPKLN